MSDSVVKKVLELATTKYAGDRVITALACAVLNAQEMCRIDLESEVRFQRQGVDLLTGYSKGALGEEGYSAPVAFPHDAVTPYVRRIDNLRTFSERFGMLVVALQALDEEIDY